MSRPAPPAPQTRYPRRRSLAGPVVLIALGVIFLLGNMRVLTWPRLAHYFALYWPLLLILWGLIKLVEHWHDNRAGLPGRGIGAGGVLLIIFIVICGLSFTGAERVNWSALQNEMDVDSDFAGFFGNTYSFTQTVEQPFAPDTNLRVVSDHGSVNITSWDQPKIKVVVNKKLVARSEEESRKIDDNTRPLLTTEGPLMTLNANTTGGGNHPVESDLEVFMPRKAAVDISTRRGDISVRGRTGEVKLSTSHGDGTAQDIAGNVEMDVRRGSVHAGDVQGNVSVNGRIDDASVTNVSGSVRLTGDFFGQMNLSKIGKMVSFKSSRTDMELARLDGELKLESGDLSAKSVTGPVRLITRSKDIHIEDVSGDIRLENSNGSVELRAGNLPLGAMEIRNKRGEIQLVLPPKAAFELEASARRGDINSDFPGIKVDNAHDDSRARGTVGAGGPRLQIENSNGNIEIRKAGTNVTSLPSTHAMGDHMAFDDADMGLSSEPGTGSRMAVSVRPAFDGPGSRSAAVAIVSDDATVALPPLARKQVKRRCAIKVSGTL